MSDEVLTAEEKTKLFLERCVALLDEEYIVEYTDDENVRYYSINFTS